MLVGIPKEIKNNENRVAITPAGVRAMIKFGHEVFVQADAGAGSGISDDRYTAEGAKILKDAKDIWDKTDMVVKVKEPLPEEYSFFRKGQILFTYLHLAAESELTKALLDKKVTAVAYETVQKDDGSLPLLTPMSEVAGRMSVQIGAQFLINEIPPK